MGQGGGAQGRGYCHPRAPLTREGFNHLERGRFQKGALVAHGDSDPPATGSWCLWSPCGREKTGSQETERLVLSLATRLLCACEQVSSPFWATVIPTVKRTKDSCYLQPHCCFSPAVLC